MIDNKYVVTFNVADRGTPYNTDEERGTSQIGHMWYLLQKNDSEKHSFGFTRKNNSSEYQQGDSQEDGSFTQPGEITKKDDIGYNPAGVSSISIQINETQYNALLKFGKEEEPFHQYEYYDNATYNVFLHNCVTFVFKALNIIGYNQSNASMALTLPKTAFGYLVYALARHGAIEVKGNQLRPLGYGTIFDKNDKITGYDGNSDEIHGGDGNDILIGKGGDDELYGGRGNDVLYGDYATDSASSSSSSSSVIVAVFLASFVFVTVVKSRLLANFTKFIAAGLLSLIVIV